MPIPLAVPQGPLSLTPAQVTKAEVILAAILQVIHGGSSGATPVTPPQTVPDYSNPNVDPASVPAIPLSLETADQQIFYRHLALAIAGTVDSGSSTGGGTDTSVFEASCPDTLEVGDLVYSSGAGAVDLADPADLSRMPVVGAVVSKVGPSTAQVKAFGLISGVYSTLTPGARYIVGAQGRPGSSLPDNSSHSVIAQPIGVAVGTDSLLFIPSFSIVEY